MGNLSILENVMEEKLMSMNTAFVGKIVSINGNKSTATVQPLNKVKQYNKDAKKQSVLNDVPILANARFKLVPYDFPCVNNGTIPLVKREEIKKGDVVFCVCADRDITDTKNGSMAVPSVARHHNMSDAVIVGIL